MLKKVVLFALLILPLGVFAQELKIAHVNFENVFTSLPESEAAGKQLNAFYEQVQADIKSMRDEYFKKIEDFRQLGDSVSESIKVRRLQEINDLEERINVRTQQADQELVTKRDELNTPIIQKIQQAIRDVATERGLMYVFESNAPLFTSPDATDITQSVKTKLGVQ